jgi:mercuric ion binding protein
MKDFLKISMLFAIAGFGVNNLNAAPNDEETVKFTVEKMTCATCPIAVRKAMERVDGVKAVSVDFDSKTAVVIFDSKKTTANAIGAASTDVGFPASVVDNQ